MKEVETELRNEVSRDWGKEGRNKKESGKDERRRARDDNGLDNAFLDITPKTWQQQQQKR